MMEFRPEGEYYIKDKGHLYTGPLPVTLWGFSVLIGTEILVNGEVKTIKGVELFMHTPPWREGEPCGLMFDKPLLKGIHDYGLEPIISKLPDF